MAATTNKITRRSFTSTHPDLRKEAPESLLRANNIRDRFDDARDPYIKLQRTAMRKTEAKRREEGAKGSRMVKLHKPFPELKPKHDLSQVRASFNNAWLREQRKAKLQYMRDQKVAEPSESENNMKRFPGYGRER